MNDAEKLAEMGTDARKWAQEFVKADSRAGRPNLERLEELALGWFANAIEAGRDEGPNKERGPETLAERAIRALHEAATALEELPSGMRTAALGGLLGNIPLNNIDHLRQEADDIAVRVATFAAANREV